MAAPTAPDLFTTLRYIPATSPDGPAQSDVPLFDLHVRRLRDGFREFSGLVEHDDNTPFWTTRVWNALRQVIQDKGASHSLRVSASLCPDDRQPMSRTVELTTVVRLVQLKVTVSVTSPPTFTAEAWALPDSFRK